MSTSLEVLAKTSIKIHGNLVACSSLALAHEGLIGMPNPLHADGLVDYEEAT